VQESGIIETRPGRWVFAAGTLEDYVNHKLRLTLTERETLLRTLKELVEHLASEAEGVSQRESPIQS